MEYSPLNKNKNENLEKQAEWNKILAAVDKITDKLGKPIDAGMKETVTAFLANKLPADNSCEGHFDRGRPYPFVGIESGNKDPEFKEKIIKFTNQMKSKGYESLQDIPETETDMLSRAYEIQSEIKSHEQKIEVVLKSLLDDFYNTHSPVAPEYTLTVWKGASSFEVSPISGAGLGKENWNAFELREKTMSTKEKEEYLRNTQTEMKAFTEFLKDRFFTEK